MLGKLARWLRLLGYDTVYRRDTLDDDLLQEARSTHRVLLTRDVELANRTPVPPGGVLVRSLDPRAQVEEVVAARDLGVPPGPVLTRCSLCNTLLEEVPLEEVVHELPPDVATDGEPVWRCPGCSQVYWVGTHVAEIRALARELRSHGRA